MALNAEFDRDTGRGVAGGDLGSHGFGTVPESPGRRGLDHAGLGDGAPGHGQTSGLPWPRWEFYQHISEES